MVRRHKTPLEDLRLSRFCALLRHLFLDRFQATNGRNPPLPDPLPKGCKFFMFGSLFPSKYRKKVYIKKFDGGSLGGSKILYAEFLRVLFFAHDSGRRKRGVEFRGGSRHD